MLSMARLTSDVARSSVMPWAGLVWSLVTGSLHIEVGARSVIGGRRSINASSSLSDRRLFSRRETSGMVPCITGIRVRDHFPFQETDIHGNRHDHSRQR